MTSSDLGDKNVLVRSERKIFRLFREGVREYNLIEPGDKILIGLSGGKDSLALVELLGKSLHYWNGNVQLYAMHIRVDSVEYQVDDGYLMDFCSNYGIRYFSKQISVEPDRDTKRTPCFLCSWNRRKALFEMAQTLSCNKLALGHHQDDILQTALMNLSFNGSFSTMPVFMKMQKMPFSIIRPLCLIPERTIADWAMIRNYHPLLKVCPYDTMSKRTDAKHLLDQMDTFNPEFRSNFWHALKKEGKLVDL